MDMLINAFNHISEHTARIYNAATTHQTHARFPKASGSCHFVLPRGVSGTGRRRPRFLSRGVSAHIGLIAEELHRELCVCVCTHCSEF